MRLEFPFQSQVSPEITLFNSSTGQNHVTLQLRNPFGVVGIITPFNFPCAVLGRNACMALVTGNCVVWKGSRTTPLVTIAITKLVAGVLKNNNLPGAIFTSFCGGAPIGQAMAEDKRIPLVSFTGTSKVGLMVQQRVNDRFVVQAVLLDAVGIAGQCRITCHRLFIQETIYELVIERLLLEYTLVTIGMGDPLKTGTLLGPLHTKALKRNFRTVMQKIKSQGPLPLGNTWHAAHSDAWHVLSAGPSLSGFPYQPDHHYPDSPKDMHGVDILSGRLKERQTTFHLLLSKEEQTTLAERTHPDSLHNTSG
ncbi:Aldehyde dehydrogenase family 7 member B4 [Vitis vinifera]|uniref:Aldehyde dehydrogenase family 7 member B4 n=1 Tax=Vitis vinifera TaxID=29760 RepID=A0A438K6P7_VITVI|nr:Aldehyde dehydrogenase family 7 member B4 [Vitis vinifera]